jgi:hypothetical protein
MKRPALVYALLLAIATALASCGGGGSASSSPTPAAAPVVRFEVNYQPVTTFPGAPAAGRYLTVRALTGDTSLGTRPTASVQLVFDQEAPRTLTAPSYVDAQGRANYAFPISDTYVATLQYRNCTAWFPAHVTVTDVAGLSFSKDLTVCPIQEESIGAFSDYGDHTATFSAAGPPGVTRADFSHANSVAVLDATTSTTASGTSTWSVPAAEGDRLVAMARVPVSATPGQMLSARIDVQGGAFAQAAALSDIGAPVAWLTCCAPAPDASAALQTVTFTLSAGVYNLPQSPGTTMPVDVQYLIVDGLTGQPRQQYSGTLGLPTLSGYAEWTSQARAGDRMFIRASTSVPNGGVTVTAPGANAVSFAPGVAAQLNVFVPRSP